MEKKKLVYRSLRRLLAELRETGYELRDYFEHNAIYTDSYIGKYIENLKGYLPVVVTDELTYKLDDESIDICADLLKIIQESGFNDKVSCLYYDCNILGKDCIYTLIYHDCIGKNGSRVDSFIINRRR